MLLTTLDNLKDSIIVNGTFEKSVLSTIKNHLFAEAQVQTMKPIYQEVCEAALLKFKPVIEDRDHYKASSRRAERVGELITNYEHLYLASDEITAQIYPWHKAEMGKKGIMVDGENKCAYLVAKNLTLQTEGNLIDVMSKLTGIESKMVWRKEQRDELMKILVGLLVSLADEYNIELNVVKECLI